MTTKTMLLSSAARIKTSLPVQTDQPELWTINRLDRILSGRNGGKTWAATVEIARLRVQGVKVVDCRRSGMVEISNSTGAKTDVATSV